jgi:hypothetical protein
MNDENLISRETPEPKPSRAAHVTAWAERVKAARVHHTPAFERMREDMEFAYYGATKNWAESGKYVANLVQRHLNQRKSALYAKNPKAVFKRRPRLDFEIWDGKMDSIMMALNNAANGELAPQDIALLQDYEEGSQYRKLIDRVGKTMEALFQYYVGEQVPPFKVSAKRLVLRTCTSGVGFIRLGFQRQMQRQPEVMQQIADMTEQVARIERLAADFADGELEFDMKDAEELKLSIDRLQSKAEVLVREGLVFTFPRPTSVIIDTECTSIIGFEGASWVAREFHFTPERIREIYKVDVKQSYTAYNATKSSLVAPSGKPLYKDNGLACVWEIEDKPSGAVYTVCDGYPDYLEEPRDPFIDLERFFSFFPLIFNDIESEKEIYPPSDVRLLRHMQLDHNRAREGLREHRRANRPKYASAAGTLEDEDKKLLKNAQAHDVLELRGLKPGDDVGKLLQHIKMHPIDPALYDVSPQFDDILKTVGEQEANLGGVAGSSTTATEASIAEGSRVSSIDSNIDDLDEVLTELARASGQVVLKEVSLETVKKLVGRGAVWPELNRTEIMEEIYLTVKAGSSGRPNKAQDIANFERMAPWMMQTPGVSPRWMAEQEIQRLDDSIDLADAFIDGLPSITAMNSQPMPGNGIDDEDPNKQGKEGGNNKEKPAGKEKSEGKERGPQPAYPTGGNVGNGG